MNDRLLMSAASSLFNYVKGCGLTGKLDTKVVQAHLDALLQLAQLPNYQIELRQTVTQQLSVMVTKKLRLAGAA
jgi:preprotein translocase subunit Sec63